MTHRHLLIISDLLLMDIYEDICLEVLRELSIAVGLQVNI